MNGERERQTPVDGEVSIIAAARERGRVRVEAQPLLQVLQHAPHPPTDNIMVISVNIDIFKYFLLRMGVPYNFIWCKK